jgi:hypothetical protein
MTEKDSGTITVDVWVEGEKILARYSKGGSGTWGMLKGDALKKARMLADETSKRKTDTPNPNPLKECGQLEIDENDFMPNEE